MKVMLKIFLFFLLALVGNSTDAQQLQKIWETDSVFKVPESVLYAAKENMLYVSNIDGKDSWAKDGKGSVGKMDVNGQNIVVEWVTGLNSPKGMGLYRNMLYVADLTEVVVIDTRKAAIVDRIHIPEARGLNDVTVDEKGSVYVSDMLEKKVYRIDNGKAKVILSNLQRPNGVLAKNKTFYLLDGEAFYKLGADQSLIKIADGMEGGVDGVVQVGEKEFIISCWKGVIWFVKTDGTKKKLLDTSGEGKNTADIGYDSKTKTLYVPSFWKNTVAAYKVTD